jgi:hypothetical protein
MNYCRWKSLGRRVVPTALAWRRSKVPASWRRSEASTSWSVMEEERGTEFVGQERGPGVEVHAEDAEEGVWWRADAEEGTWWTVDAEEERAPMGVGKLQG